MKASFVPYACLYSASKVFLLKNNAIQSERKFSPRAYIYNKIMLIMSLEEYDQFLGQDLYIDAYEADWQTAPILYR